MAMSRFGEGQIATMKSVGTLGGRPGSMASFVVGHSYLYRADDAHVVRPFRIYCFGPGGPTRRKGPGQFTREGTAP